MKRYKKKTKAERRARHHAWKYGVSLEVYNFAVARHIVMKRIKAHQPYMSECDCIGVIKDSMITGAQAEPVHRV